MAALTKSRRGYLVIFIHYFYSALISDVSRPLQTIQLTVSVKIQLLNVAVIYYYSTLYTIAEDIVETGDCWLSNTLDGVGGTKSK